MKNTFVKLAVVAAIVLVVAVWVAQSRRPAETAQANTEVVAGLRDHVNDVKSLRLVGAGNATIVTLARGERGWTVVEKHGYAADVAKVREFLLKLADARRLEAKTSNPELHAKLGVEDLDKADAKGTRVEIDGLAQPVKLIVGNFSGQGGDGTFVRTAGEPQSWLARGNLVPDRTAANWLQRDLLDIATSRIADVSIVHQGRTLRAFKTTGDEENYAVADVPKNRELSSAFVANGLASVLSSLRFDDVMPAAEAEPGDAKTFAATYTGFDGLVVTMTAWERDDRQFARFTASLDEARMKAHIDAEQARARATFDAEKAAAAAPAAPAAPATTDGATPAPAATSAKPDAAVAPVEPLAVADPAKDRAIREEALRKEVADLQARVDGWTFVIPAYKWANVNKTMDDMLKPLGGK